MASSGKTRLHRLLPTDEFHVSAMQILLTESPGTIASHECYKEDMSLSDGVNVMLILNLRLFRPKISLIPRVIERIRRVDLKLCVSL